MPKHQPTRREPSKDAAAAAAPVPVVTLKPRKGLFVALCVAFAVWVGLLTTLYFTTVRGRVDPHGHDHGHAHDHADGNGGAASAPAPAR